MKYFSMFSGIGGFEIGIQNAYRSAERGEQTNPQGNQGQGLLTKEGQDTSTEDGRISERPTDGADERPLCIGYSEIDKYAIATYEKNFGKEIKNYGDATTINTAELPDFDLLVGGFPCQAFSVAGKRAGFNDTRGTLIFDVVRILRDKRPRYFVLENVKGLLSHDSGKTFSHILEILTDSGYDVSWSIHNSKNYGVPQNRERIYLIGSLRGTPRPQVFPIGQDDETYHGQDEPLTANTLTANYWKGPAASRPLIRQLNQPTHSNDRVYASDGISPTLNTMQGGNRQPFIAEDVRIRRLTPIECERLQGFPDNWTIGSDTQRYKQCGNAVTVNVVEHVVSEMFNPTQS